MPTVMTLEAPPAYGVPQYSSDYLTILGDPKLGNPGLGVSLLGFAAAAILTTALLGWGAAKLIAAANDDRL